MIVNLFCSAPDDNLGRRVDSFFGRSIQFGLFTIINIAPDPTMLPDEDVTLTCSRTFPELSEMTAELVFEAGNGMAKQLVSAA